MGKTLYLECLNGISGDMTAAALLDLGADQTVLEHALKSLPVSGFTAKISRVKKAGLDACDFAVILAHENHDHDMHYLHGNENPHAEHGQPAGREHAHDKEHAQPAGQEHAHDKEHARHHHHEHRSLSDILSIIEQAEMTAAAKKTAADIFTILGRAEAKAHGTPLEQVHFHEAGAVDSIVDIVAAAVCLDNLEITDVIIPVLYEGCGTVRCQHGILPIPVPAVTHIVQAHALPLHMTGMQGELITPTGAAIAAAVRTGSRLPQQFQILRTGLGAGKRSYERPSILRAMLIKPLPSQPDSSRQADTIYKLETNIDDCSGEALGYVLECLLQAGANDVHYFPVYMKKNRPAYQLNVLCRQADIEKLEQIIFAQTTTIGIRRQRMERTVLPREIKTFHTSYGEIQAKICYLDKQMRIYPEYESVAAACARNGMPYPQMYDLLKKACTEQLH